MRASSVHLAGQGPHSETTERLQREGNDLIVTTGNQEQKQPTTESNMARIVQGLIRDDEQQTIARHKAMVEDLSRRLERLEKGNVKQEREVCIAFWVRFARSALLTPISACCTRCRSSHLFGLFCSPNSSICSYSIRLSFSLH